jgi:hypothetical protein
MQGGKEIMKPMIWHPEEKDQKVNEYFSQVNRAPYGTIALVMLGVFVIFTFIVLVGIF